MPVATTLPARRPSRRPKPDQACVDAIETALGALLDDVTADRVGPHLGVEVDDDRVVTHRFACTDPAYRGWAWCVTVARASRGKQVTVDEVCLLPDADALRAPAWLPWRDRLRPGDLSVGDILPAEHDDPRLVPGYAEVEPDRPLGLVDEPGPEGGDGAAGGEGSWAPLGWEIGLGRVRVLSRYGRDDAAERWWNGDHGPTSPHARSAPGTCVGCGFLVRLAGPLGAVFGVCANVYAPDDGRVVSLDHGCGAHSEGVMPAAAGRGPLLVDEFRVDEVRVEGARDGGVRVAGVLVDEVRVGEVELPEPRVAGTSSAAATRSADAGRAAEAADAEWLGHS